MDWEIDFHAIRTSVAEGKIEWRKHALERLLERGITRQQVRKAILNGKVIEIYPKDRPYPSCLVHHAEPEPLHVIVAFDPDFGNCHVITVYQPDMNHFEPDLKTRRKR